jgi:hypothetical protein
MLLTPDLTGIELEVADLKFSASTFRQKARPTELTMRFLPTGDVELLLTMSRQAYGVATDGSFGDVVPATYVQLPAVRLLADRTVAVDPTDGFPRYRLITPSVAIAGGGLQPGSARNTLTQEVETFAEGQDWPAFLQAKPEALILQDKYFGEMCRSGQVNINALLLAYAQQADAAPSIFAAS